ncbi:MAG TPA: ATPase domain-containing protein [Thermomicrobiales bacterium]|nr:ATPase domain-containing protein [Thermomicrobiales bacterium]
MSGTLNGLVLPVLGRTPTGIPGLDAVLGGGLPAGRTCLIAGPPGSGKTTLGNQMAFTHAGGGGSVIYATLHTETHDIMLSNLRDLRCFDSSIPGDRIRYLNLLAALEQGGLDGVSRSLAREMQEVGATLLVVDSSVMLEETNTLSVELRHFAERIEAQAALLECTTVLLTSTEQPELVRPLASHANGIIHLSNQVMDSRQVRLLEVAKLRGAEHVGGVHELSISREGVVVHPRLESLAGSKRSTPAPGGLLSSGVPGLDEMLGGGIPAHSSTLVLGTPGAGKTLLGLTFLAEGASRGEKGLMAGFHETAEELVATGERIGLDLGVPIETRRLRMQWDPPLDLSADAWAWRLLSLVESHRPQRVFVDALTDIQRLIPSPRRLATFLAALTNELRTLGTTAMFSAEIDAYVDQQFAFPIPSASAAMDNAILVRHVEVHSELRRVITALKARQTRTDPAIREMVVDERGVRVVEPLTGISSMLTGRGAPLGRPELGALL